MKKDVMVDVVSLLDALDGDEPEKVTLTTRGTFEEENGIVKIKYSEEDEDGKTDTVLTVLSSEHIQTSREGPSSFQLNAEKDKRYSCCYDTPYGVLMMGVFASEVSAKFTKTGAKLHMKYTIDFNSSLASENTVDITVRDI